jgi:carbon monoxide dehydrogenase subunit G
MATVHKEIHIDVPVDAAWAAIRDVGAVDRRLAPGLVVKSEIDGDARVVTFANGLVVRELIVTIDDTARRLAYASVGGRARHHNASMQVLPEGGGTRFIWTTDVLPDELAESIRGLVEQGTTIFKKALEGS